MGAIVPAGPLAALDRGASVITGNERSARMLRRAWDRQQAARGLKHWQPAAALSWRSWTHGLWRTLLLEGRTDLLLMNQAQEHQVWLLVLAEDKAASTLRGQNALATLAATAWQRLCAYLGEAGLRQRATALQGDTASFASWAKRFRELCGEHSLLSEAMLDAALTRLTTTIRPEGELVLYAFDHLTPAQTTLVDALRTTGVKISPWTEATVEGSPEPSRTSSDPEALASPRTTFQCVSATDETAELRGCARFVREMLRARGDTRIGVVVADLHGLRDQIDSIFREVLAEDPRQTPSSESAFEFSLGRPLHHEPVVRAALDLLRWSCGPLELPRVSSLLLSPYFAAAHITPDEQAARAEFDARGLRRSLRLRPEVTIAELHSATTRDPQLASRLRTLRSTFRELETAQSRFDLRGRGFGPWTEWLRQWLALARWGSSARRISSREYQACERWEEVLDTLATLDFMGGAPQLPEVLATLERVVRETIFAPESQDAPVQIMGPGEAAGSRFDCLWVLRAGEFNWPPSASAHPLLPLSLQHNLGMPGADAVRDRERAEQLTRRLAHSADRVFFSYARRTGEGGHQRLASAVRELGWPEAEITSVLPAELPRTVVELERIVDAGRLPPVPPVVHSGGVRVLELQAACGFRAFAEMRLGAGDLRERELGLSAGERGSIVHDALEAFWKEVGSQERLRTMTEGERTAALTRAIHHGLRRATAQVRGRWDEAYNEAQRARLRHLLRGWLAIELSRPDFVVKTSEESRQSVEIGPLRLSLRLDRVDLVEGEQVVIDYKSYEARTADWLGERPDRPQVPLYALVASGVASLGREEAPSPEAPLGAVAFAQVRPGKDMQLCGLEARPGVLTVPAGSSRPAAMDAGSFDEQMARWHEVLERLATDFVHGDVRVWPKRFPQTCERCSQRLLCRVDAALFAEVLDDETASEDQAFEDRDG